jgi:hypothetical protein
MELDNEGADVVSAGASKERRDELHSNNTPSVAATQPLTTAASICETLSCERSGCNCAATARRGHGLTHCPAHDDRTPSLSVSEEGGKVLVHCGANCSQDAVINALRERGLWETRAERRRNGSNNIVATYSYNNLGGDLVHQTVRYEPKGFKQRRPDGNGGWIWDLKGIVPILYRLPQLVAADPSEIVYICEGEKDADRLAALGFIATTSAMGAGKWRSEYADSLRGRKVRIIPDKDSDDTGLKHALGVAASLHGVAADVRILELPNLREHGDVSDFLNNGGSADKLRELAEAAPVWEPEPVPAAVEPRTLAGVLAAFDKWLYLEDKGIILVVLAAVAANEMQGDPVWLMLVSASSSGKTETLNAISHLPHIHAAATMTEASLLSGTPKKERGSDARGGLLKGIGDFGILCCKDFTSVLSMNRDSRAALLAALREIFDGAWTRHVGVDGGRTLSWEGKMGLVAGCTAAIDSHRSVMATMGERFLLYRLPDVDPRKQARKALGNTGRERDMRRELSEAVSGLFAGLDLQDQPPELTEKETDRLVALASLVARTRSAVERDGYSRDIELILDPEAPARIVQALRRLYGGLLAIGVERAEAMDVIVKVGMDCLPKVRRAVFDLLVDTDEWMDTPHIATAICYPTNTTRRTLEDLQAHKIVQRQLTPGKADNWHLADWARSLYQEARFPEMSVGVYIADPYVLNKPQNVLTDFSGTRSETPIDDDADADDLPFDDLDVVDDAAEGRCPWCNGDEWWMRPDGSGPVCCRCHPQPLEVTT